MSSHSPVKVIKMTASQIGYVAHLREDVSAYFEFTLPREDRTCPTGLTQAQPVVTVRTGASAPRENWVKGSLGEVNDELIAQAFNDAVGLEHGFARQVRALPVPIEVVERFREIDEEATVPEIREANRAARGLREEGFTFVDATALWIARNYVHASTYEAEVARLETRVSEEERNVEEANEAPCECEPAVSPQDQAQPEAIESLRLHGEAILEFRPGATVIDKVLDLLDDVGQ